MFVLKRNGEKEPIFFDKIAKRNRVLAEGNDLNLEKLNLDQIKLAIKVIEGLYDGIRTDEIDMLSAETAISMSTHNLDYEALASRLCISNLHKLTREKFSVVTKELSDLGFMNTDYVRFVQDNADALDEMVDYYRDYTTSYFGFKTLEKSYLNRDLQGKVIERPQHVWMRVATYLRMPDMGKIK